MPADSTSPGAGPGATDPLAYRRRDDPGAPFPLDVRLSTRASWGLIGVFVLLITLPAVLREFSDDNVRGAMAAVGRPGAAPVAERLRAVEARIDAGAWIVPIRERLQSVMYHVFREGNRKVLIGRDGWFFHRPGVQALTGRGPVLGPTHSVAKDPALKEWVGPLPVIREFAAQLKERGLRLVLVPVPDKAAMASAHLRLPTRTPAGARLRHPDWQGVVDGLRGHLELVDLDQSLPYLSDDTHWEVAGARSAAAAVAGVVRPGDLTLPETSSDRELSGHGDLVASLGLVKSAAARLHRTFHGPSVAPFVSDPTASIVLLGDSNVNMYDDPSLPFHQPGAGFGSWLSACLKEPLHLIAINGGGATQVRQRFAALPDDVVRAKKTVIWVLAERDLLMDPSVARANGVEWKRVVFNPHASSSAEPIASGDALVVEATLKAKSKVLDMAAVNYPDAVFSAEFTLDRVVSGTYAEKELAVVLWNFRNRVVQPTARLTPGQKVRLTLVPWLEQGELTKTNLEDDFQRFDLPLLYAEKAELIAD